MPNKIYHSVNTFNAGEISELLFNREDISKYKSACRVLENAFPLVEGGAKKMPGTYFAGPALNAAAPCRLVPFQFSTAQGAILEFSAGVIRIWEPLATGTWTLGLVESGSPPTPIQLTTPYEQTDLFALDCGTQSADVLWIFHPSYAPACVERLGPSSWQFTNFPPGLDPGEPAYRGTPDVVSTGFSGLGVSILQITQASPAVMVTDSAFNYGDRVYINECAGMVELNEGEFFIIPALAVGDAASFTGGISGGETTQYGTILNVTAVASGTLLIGMQINGPNVSPGTTISAYLSGNGSTGTYQVNISQLVNAEDLSGLGGFAYNLVECQGGAVFTGSILGTTLTVDYITAGNIYVGMAVDFPGVVIGTIITALGTGMGGAGTYTVNISQTAPDQPMSSVPVPSTSFQAYAGGGFAVKVIPFFNTVNNYPACGTFYQGRLYTAGTNANPTTLYGSVQDDYPNFISDPNEDDYGVQFTLVSTLLDQAINLIGTPTALIVGTAGGIWAVAGLNGGSLSQSSVLAAKQTTLGVSQLQPQLVGSSAIFVSRSAKQVMFLIYDFVSNQWNNYDLTRLNRQITIGPSPSAKQLAGIVQTAFQSEPYPIMWAVRGDGQLIGLVFNTQDQVYAWFRVNMLPENAIIESVAVITGQNQEDMVVISVQRTINGAVVRYIEYFMPQELFNNLANAFFVHCGLQLNLGPAIAITNITNASPATVTAPGQNFANGSFVQIAGVLGMTRINQDKGQAYTVINSNPVAGTFQLQGMDTLAFGQYTGGGTALPVTNTVTGLTYLLGQTVVAVGDYALIQPPTVVTSDSMTFQYYCAQITIGLPYNVTIQPTNPIATGPISTTRGQKQKLTRATISLYQSMGGKVGTDLAIDHMYDLTYGPGQLMQIANMSTLEYTPDLDGDWDDESTLYITQSDPFPFTLRGLVMRMSYNLD